jgi:hypothetical protein
VPIDLAIVCVAAFEQAPEDDYPEALVRVLAPRRLLLGHWESFFQDWTDQISQLRSVPQTDPRHFVERLQAASPEASWVMPIPGTSLSY